MPPVLPWKVRNAKRAEYGSAQTKLAGELAEQCLKGDAALQVTFAGYVLLLGFLAAQTNAVTHEQLLLDSVVTVSLGQAVGFKVSTFFWTAPLVFVGLHFRVVWLLRAAAGRVNIFREKVAGYPDDVKREANVRIGSMLLSHIVEGAQPLRSTLQAAMILMLAVLPVVEMLHMQLAFLPYHSEAITWIQRASVFACIALGWWSLSLLRVKVVAGALLRRMLTYTPHVVVTTAALISVFFLVIPGEALERWEVAAFRRLAPTMVAEPFRELIDATPPPRLGLDENGAAGIPATSFTRQELMHRPRNYLDPPLLVGCSFWASKGGACRNATPALAPVAYLFAPFARPLGVSSFRLQRNLELADDSLLDAARLTAADRQVLQEHSKLAALTPGFGTILDSLPVRRFQDRDLRFARLRGAWLVNADFVGALTDGMVLRGARLFGAQLSIAVAPGSNRLDGIDISGGALRLTREENSATANQWASVRNVVAIAARVELEGNNLAINGWDLRQAYIETTTSSGSIATATMVERRPRRSLGGALSKFVQPEGLVLTSCDLSFSDLMLGSLMEQYSIRVELSDATGASIWNGTGLDGSDQRKPAELVFVRSLLDWAELFLDRQSHLHLLGTVPRYSSIQAQSVRRSLPTGSVGVRAVELLPWERWQARSKHAEIDTEFPPCAAWRLPQGCVPITAHNAALFAYSTAKEWCARFSAWPLVAGRSNHRLPRDAILTALEHLHEVAPHSARTLVAKGQACLSSPALKDRPSLASLMALEVAEWSRTLEQWSRERRPPLGLRGRPATMLLAT